MICDFRNKSKKTLTYKINNKLIVQNGENYALLIPNDNNKWYPMVNFWGSGNRTYELTME